MKAARLIIAAAWLAGVGLAHAALLNRWSFNDPAGAAPSGTVFFDSVSGVPATVKSGTGSTSAILTGFMLILPGTTTGAKADSSISAYLDLPNGLISSKTNLTVELWAQPISSKSWQRLFEFGRMVTGDNLGAAGEWTGATAPRSSQALDSLNLVFEQSTSLSSQLAGIKHNSTTISYNVSGALATTLGTEYHYVLTFEDGLNMDGTANPSGGRLKWYRNAVLVGAVSVPFHLNNLADVNNWIGRSQSSADSLANIAYDEFRIYDQALTQAEITASFNAGPDPAAPVAQPDTVTMHPGQKALIAVLANDNGMFLQSTVTVVQPPQFGTATPDGKGNILYIPTTGTPTTDTFTYCVSGVGGQSAPATVTINFATGLRIANASLNVPGSPPPTAVQIGPAFPGIAAFSQPVCLATAPGDSKRLFICERSGLLKLIPDVTAATPTKVTFLDLPTLLSSRGETLGGLGTAYNSGNEQGLLGLAFHPAYATNGYFYVYYSVVSPSTGTSIFERLSRFSVNPADPNSADPNSEVILFNQLDPDVNHNGGDLHFGNDGYLYISLGDGKFGPGQPDGNGFYAQHIDGDLVSGILRIDVDNKPGNLPPNQKNNTDPAATPVVPFDNGVPRYLVPADNPFVGATTFNGLSVNPAAVHTEFYAVGLRNPWRFSIDTQPGGTGEIWEGDVGLNTYEEINLIKSGGNYGWPYVEGTISGPRSNEAPAGFTSLTPYYEYAHSGVLTPPNPNYEGFCIIGGLIYRGSHYASLQGKYIFADYGSGNIWTLTRNDPSPPTITRIAGLTGLVAFGTDPSNGDVLALQIVTGTIERLTVNTTIGSFPQNLSDTGLFADLTDLSPNPGVLPYQPNLAFWSDFAVKSRWFVIPDGTSTMTWSRDGAWTFPTGMIWVKHFDLELNRTNPPTTGGTGPRQRIETRLLVQTATGVYGVSYRWNAAGTDATLVDDAGADFDVPLVQNGSPYTQHWHIPSRAECATCHNAIAGGSLSFTTRQLNQVQTMNGFTGNQLDLLSAGGYFANTPDAAQTLPRHVRPDDTAYPLETRARAYFAVNCANCHQTGGTGPSWNGRPELTLEQTGLINGNVINNGGNPANKLVVPTDTLHSVILSRVSATNGFARMPPLATNELDQTSISLLTQWIQNYDPNRQFFSDWQLANFGSTSLPAAAPDADPDGDSLSNLVEYLIGSSPVIAQPTPGNLTVSLLPSGLVSASYTLSVNAIAQLQYSTDLINWSVWNVPGNDGLPTFGGLQTIQGQAIGDKMFFRLLLNQH